MYLIKTSICSVWISEHVYIRPLHSIPCILCPSHLQHGIASAGLMFANNSKPSFSPKESQSHCLQQSTSRKIPKQSFRHNSHLKTDHSKQCRFVVWHSYTKIEARINIYQYEQNKKGENKCTYMIYEFYHGRYWGSPPAFHTLAKDMSLNQGATQFIFGLRTCIISSFLS